MTQQGTLEDLADLVNQAFEDLGVTAKAAAPQLGPLMDLSVYSTTVYIGDVRNRKLFLPQNPETTKQRRLDYLAILLYALHVEEGEEIIGRIQEMYPNFNYPPTEDKQYRLPEN